MADFIDPFKGVVPDRKLTPRELARAIRLSLSAEQEAVHLYEAVADAADNELAKAVLQEIANEERVHAGEFLRLLKILLPDEEQLLTEGAGEVDELAAEMGKAEPEQPPAAASEPIPSVGDLKD